MYKISCLILCFISLSILTTGVKSKPFDGCDTTEWGDVFYLRGQEDLASWNHQILVTKKADTDDDDNANIYAMFESICLSFNGDVELTSGSDYIGKTDKQTAFEWGTKIDIYDCDGTKSYIIEEGDS